MTNLPSSVQKYLSKFSSLQWEIESKNLSGISNAIIIPAISEFENIKQVLKSLSENDDKYFNSTIVLLVINNMNSSDLKVISENLKSLIFIRSLIDQSNSESTGLDIINSGLRIGVIDASSEGKEFSEKEGGVGMARKVGMDLALKIFNYNSKDKKILICLDADCKVQNNYLTKVVDNYNKRNLSAAVIKYEHKIGESGNIDAIVCYEIFLRYYVLGLKYAGSPYAYNIIGSAITCDYESYIKVEGMNKRKAAEDFYFLEKLAKRDEIPEIKSTTVYPSSRRSWRVPFGTGQRMKRFLSKTHNEYLLYDPEIFFILKEWLRIFNDIKVLSADEYLSKANDIHPLVKNFLLENNFVKAWDKILSTSKSNDQVNRQKVNWFDAFRTLKFIHYLRDDDYPMLNMFDVLDITLNKYDVSVESNRNENEIPPLEKQITYLTILRDLT